MSVNTLNIFNITTNWNELDQECAATELALISESINKKQVFFFTKSLQHTLSIKDEDMLKAFIILFERPVIRQHMHWSSWY